MMCEFTFIDESKPETTGVIVMESGPLKTDVPMPQYIMDMKGNKVKMDDVRSYEELSERGQLAMPMFQNKQERDTMKIGLALLQNTG